MDYKERAAQLIGEIDTLQEKIAELERAEAERKRAEETLQALSSRYEAILAAVPDIIMEVDANKVYTWANQTGFEFFGEDVLGKEAAFYFEGEQDTYSTVQPLFDGDEDVIYVESWQRRRDGEKRLLAWWCRVLKDANGNVTGALSTAQDITERKQAEGRIQCQLQRLTALREIDMAITSSMELSVIFNVILDQVTTELRVDAADVLLLNPHTQLLEYAAGRGFRTTVLQHTRLRLGEGYAGRAALERRVINIPHLADAEDGLGRAPLLSDENFVTYYGAPLIAKGQVKGVLEIFNRARLTPDSEWLDFLETIARQAAIAIDNTCLFEDLQRSNVQLILAYDTTLEGWSRALELRDFETEGHTRRVTEMTLRLARDVGMDEAELVHVRRGVLLHDIGKMGVPDAILHKTGPLTDEEWEVMRKHPTYAQELLLPIPHLRPALDIPYCHHEKWDGSGYPRGLKGEGIPLAARVFAVVDVWEALTSDRPYRPAWPEEKALDYIRQQAGKHFDPQVVEAFLELVMGNESTR